MSRRHEPLPDGLSYAEFFNYYLREHRKRTTRHIHYIGTVLGTSMIPLALIYGAWWLIPVGVFIGYGHAWVSHFFVEKNTPAAFKYPVWSYLSDYRMLWLWASGRLNNALIGAGIDPKSGQLLTSDMANT